MMISNFKKNEFFINSEFYEINKKKIMERQIKVIDNNNNDFLYINSELLLNYEIFKYLIENKNDKTLFFDNLSFSHIKILQDNYINAYLNNQKISTNSIISCYTEKDIKTIKKISLTPQEIIKSGEKILSKLPKDIEIDRKSVV